MSTRRRLTGASVVAAVLALCIGAPLVVLAGRSAYDLSVVKTHQGNFTQGSNGTFTVTLSATTISGNSTINGETLTATDTLPSGLSYVTAGGPSFSCSASGQVVTCTGTPTMTTSQTVTFTVVAGAASVGTLTNSVSYTDQFAEDTNTANNSATDVVTVDATSSSTTTPTTTSTGTVSPTSTIAAPSAGVSPAGGSGGAGLLVALLATGGVLGGALGISAWRRR